MEPHLAEPRRLHAPAEQAEVVGVRLEGVEPIDVVEALYADWRLWWRHSTLEGPIELTDKAIQDPEALFALAAVLIGFSWGVEGVVIALVIARPLGLMIVLNRSLPLLGATWKLMIANLYLGLAGRTWIWNVGVTVI